MRERSTWHTAKQTVLSLDFRSRDMLNIDFLEKGVGIVSPPHFVYDFSRKKFFMLYPVNWPTLIVSLPLLLKILGKVHVLIAW